MKVMGMNQAYLLPLEVFPWLKPPMEDEIWKEQGLWNTIR